MTIFIICALLAAAAFFYAFPLYKEQKQGLLVLTYHNVGIPPAGCRQKGLWIKPKKFQKQLEQLKKNGFTFVSAAQVTDGNLPQKSVMITFDNGYKNFFSEAFPILGAANAPCLVFLPVQYIGKCNFWHDVKKGPWQPIMNEEEILSLNKSGLITFGSKTLTNADLSALPAEERDNQISESAFRLKNYGIEPSAFAYPYSRGFENEEIKNKVSSVYPLQFADTGRINPLPVDKGNVISRIQVKSCWCKLKFFLKITGR